jgi:RNA polymerase sigma-70 factor (ECF subfamily)
LGEPRTRFGYHYVAPVHVLARPRLSLVRVSALADADDGALGRASIDGQVGAPAAVWTRFSTLVEGVLRRTLGPGADVEDQTQETFIQFFKEAKNLRNPDALRSFLIGIAVRVARSELRRRRFRRWLRLTEDGVVPEAIDRGVDDSAREAVTRLYALLDRVDDKSRLLFVLRHIQGLELTETAESLGLSPATTKRKLLKVTARVHQMAASDPVLREYIIGTRGEEAPDEEAHHG